VRTSNAGHALATGIANRDRARRIADGLMHTNSIRVGVCARWPPARRATIRCPTTTGRSGRTTTPSRPGAWPGTATERYPSHVRRLVRATTHGAPPHPRALLRLSGPPRPHAVSCRVLTPGPGPRAPLLDAASYVGTSFRPCGAQDPADQP
jgi:hypothetical protein